MQKNSARIKQDRTLSLDIANVLSPVSNFSATMPLSDAKMMTLRKYTPNTAINAQETLRTVLEDHIFNNQMHYVSQNNSPTSRSKPPRKSLIPTHPNTSAMNNSRPSSRSKRGEYSLSISHCKEKENENDFSLNNAIQKAYTLQVEKEKQLKESKIEAEQELRQLNDNIKTVEKNIVIQKNHLNDQQLNLLVLMKGFGDSLNAPGSISKRSDHTTSNTSFGDRTTAREKSEIEEEKIQLFSIDHENELEKNELMKMLVDINTNLSQDLRVFQDMLENRNYLGFANLDTSSFQSIINANEENFRCLINEKNLLIRKMYEIEDKLHQANETKNMITEDINSHVVSITEGVVLQEEMEQMLESLRSRNPVFFNKILQEVELNDKLMEIGFEVKKRETALQEVMQARNKDENKLSRYLQESHQIYIEIENLKDLELASKEKLLDSQVYLYNRFQQCFDEIPMSQENLDELDEYICVFRLYNRKESEFKEYEARILEYQSQIFQEMQIVLQTRQDIDNLENTLLKLHLGANREAAQAAQINNGSRPGTPSKTSSYIPICDKRIVTKSIQDEIINKKMKLAEKTASFSFTKNILISNIAENTPLRGILTGHASLSFFEIMKKIGNNLDTSSYSKLVSLMLSLVNNSKVQAETYQKLAKAVGPKNDRLLELSTSIQDLKKNVAHYDHAIQQEMPKFKAIKEEEALYSSHKQLLEESYKGIIMTETKRDYQSYMQEHEKRLKKIRFQYGKQFVTKFTSDLMDDYLNSNMSSLNKFKMEIQEVHEMVLKMEEYRIKTSSKLENELKPALENVRKEIREYRIKLDDLNCDLLDIIDNEERIAQTLNQNYGGNSRVQSAREVGNGITYANNIYTSFQVYKGRISDLFKNIIEGFRKVLEREILTPSKNMELKLAMERIQQEINALLDKHIKFLNMAEKELKEYQNLIADKEAKLQYYQVQLQKSKNFYEISDQLLKTKEESTATTNQTTQGKEVDPYKTRFKGRLKSSRSVSKLSINLKENVEPERTTCTMDLTTKRNSVTSTSTPKVNTPEPRKFWLQSSGNKATGHARSQTPNMTSFSSINNQNINFENERISIRVRPSHVSQEQNSTPITGKTDRAPKSFNLDEDQMKELLKEFENGLPVHKKLNTNTSGLKPPSWNQTTTIKVEKNGEVKGFGKRLLRVNLSAKSIEVIKLTGPQMRRTLEYIYLWKDLKKVFVPPPTLKQARELLSEGMASSNEMLQFSLDVVEKGRIDFLNINPWHLAIVWNIVNQILTQGRIVI